jgi:hypothetical protein
MPTQNPWVWAPNVGLCFTHEPESRDREIVGVQKQVSKGRPKIPPKSCSVDTDPQV